MKSPTDQRNAFAWALGWWFVRRTLRRRAERAAVVAASRPAGRSGCGAALAGGVLAVLAALAGAAWFVRRRDGAGAE
ncbi:MAG: hypothetical protein EXQ77_06430 [Thermoleophilia bacterium]|nr:hypothetical protein [Thermoleophilia bacterium]